MTDVTNMTIRELALVLGWSRKYTADYVHHDERTVRRWDQPGSGRVVPQDIRKHLETLAAFHLSLPEPQSIVDARERRLADGWSDGSGREGEEEGARDTAG